MSLVSLVKAQQKLAEHDPARWKVRRGEKLRRYLEARERALGVELIVRRRGRARTELEVDLATLRRHCPELFPKGASRRGADRELRDLLREAIDQRVREEVEEHVRALVEPRLRSVEDRVSRLELVRGR